MSSGAEGCVSGCVGSVVGWEGSVGGSVSGWLGSGCVGSVAGLEGAVLGEVTGWEGVLSGVLEGTVDGSLTPLSVGCEEVACVVVDSLGRVGTTCIRSAYHASIRHRIKGRIAINIARTFFIIRYILSVFLVHSVKAPSIGVLTEPTKGLYPGGVC